MKGQKLNSSIAIEVLKCINEVYKRRLSDVQKSFFMDNEVYQITCMEWVEMLQKYSLTLIELIDELFLDATKRIDILEKKNQNYALKCAGSDGQSRGYVSDTSCNASSQSKSDYSAAEQRLCFLHSEESSYIDILNNEIQALVEICDVQNENMKAKELQFSEQKDKIVTLVKGLMTRIQIGQQRLSKFLSAVLCINQLLTENSKVYESDSSIFEDLRSKILEMRCENKCLKDQIHVLQVQNLDMPLNRSSRIPRPSSIQKPRCSSQECLSASLDSKLQCDLKMKTERIERLRDNNAQLQRELKKSCFRSTKSENKFHQEKEKVSKLLEENCRMIKTLQTLREGDADRATQIHNLSQKLYEKTDEINTLKELNSTLLEHSKTQDYNSTKYTTVCNTLSETQDELKCLKEVREIEKQSQRKSICSLEKMCNEKDIILKTLRENLDNTLDSLKTKSAEFCTLKEKYCEMEADLNKARSDLKSSQDLLSKSQDANAEQIIEIHDLNDEITKLKATIEDLKQQVRDSRRSSPIRQQNESLNCEISSLKSINFDLNRQIETLNEKLQKANETINDLNTRSESEQDEVKGLKEKLQIQTMKVRETVRKFDLLVEEFNELQESYNKILYDHDCANETIKSLEATIADKSKKNCHLKRHLEKLMCEREKLTVLNCDLKAKNQFLCHEQRQLVAENCDLASKNQTLHSQIDQCCCNF